MSRVNIIAILALVLLVFLVALFLALRPGTPEGDVAQGDVAQKDAVEETLIDVTIQESGMVPEEITVEEGEQAVLLIDTQRPIEFHLHGYDLTTEVEPSNPEELPFDATITGRFEIENHASDPHEALGALVVQPQ